MFTEKNNVVVRDPTGSSRALESDARLPVRVAVDDVCAEYSVVMTSVRIILFEQLVDLLQEEDR